MGFYSPKTKEEIADSKLFEDGVYGFEIFSAQEKVSQKGVNYLALGLKVFTDEGQTKVVNDMMADEWDGGEKLFNLAEAVGLASEYANGDLTTSSFVGASGYAKIVKGKAKGDFPAQMQVRAYLPAVDESAKNPAPVIRQAQAAQPEFSDDVPF